MLGGGIHLVDLLVWLIGERPAQVVGVGNRIADARERTSATTTSSPRPSSSPPAWSRASPPTSAACTGTSTSLRVVRHAGDRSCTTTPARACIGRAIAQSTRPIALAPLPAGKGEPDPRSSSPSAVGRTTPAETLEREFESSRPVWPPTAQLDRAQLRDRLRMTAPRRSPLAAPGSPTRTAPRSCRCSTGYILTHGPQVQDASRQEFAGFIGRGAHCVSVSSCMAALHLAYLHARHRPRRRGHRPGADARGDRPRGRVGRRHAGLRRLRPRPPATSTARTIERAITPRTQGDRAGPLPAASPCDMDPIVALAHAARPQGRRGLRARDRHPLHAASTSACSATRHASRSTRSST